LTLGAGQFPVYQREPEDIAYHKNPVDYGQCRPLARNDKTAPGGSEGCRSRQRATPLGPPTEDERRIRFNQTA